MQSKRNHKRIEIRLICTCRTIIKQADEGREFHNTERFREPRCLPVSEKHLTSGIWVVDGANHPLRPCACISVWQVVGPPTWCPRRRSSSARPALGPMGAPVRMPRARASLDDAAATLYQPRRHRPRRHNRRRYGGHALAPRRAAWGARGGACLWSCRCTFHRLCYGMRTHKLFVG